MGPRWFDGHAPAGLLPSENTDLISPGAGKRRNPDLTYLPAEALATTDNQVPAEVAAIAVDGDCEELSTVTCSSGPVAAARYRRP